MADLCHMRLRAQCAGTLQLTPGDIKKSILDKNLLVLALPSRFCQEMDIWWRRGDPMVLEFAFLLQFFFTYTLSQIKNPSTPYILFALLKETGGDCPLGSNQTRRTLYSYCTVPLKLLYGPYKATVQSLSSYRRSFSSFTHKRSIRLTRSNCCRGQN